MKGEIMKKKYRNSQADIGIEFDYEDNDDLKMNFEGIMFDLMEFISEYNLEEECVDYLNLHNAYYLGDDFRAFYLKDMNVDLFLERGILSKE